MRFRSVEEKQGKMGSRFCLSFCSAEPGLSPRAIGSAEKLRNSGKTRKRGLCLINGSCEGKKFEKWLGRANMIVIEICCRKWSRKLNVFERNWWAQCYSLFSHGERNDCDTDTSEFMESFDLASVFFFFWKMFFITSSRRKLVEACNMGRTMTEASLLSSNL